jgi:DNA polymerase-1
MIVDADLSQIEWRVCAELTQDPVMMNEIIEGRDQHAFTCTNMMELPLTKENRTDAKIFNFRAIYANPESAAYAYCMDARMPNFSQRKWDKILEAFFTHYRGMVQAHGEWVREVRTNNGQFVGPTGRIWKFKKKLKKGVMDYSVSDIYNYPVQGTAGDIIKLALIKIRQQIIERRLKTLLVNTVHDSIIFDAPEHEVEEIGTIALDVFKHIPQYVEQYFGWKITVPITGEVEYGPSWGEMKPLMIGV